MTGGIEKRKSTGLADTIADLKLKDEMNEFVETATWWMADEMKMVDKIETTAIVTTTATGTTMVGMTAVAMTTTAITTATEGMMIEVEMIAATVITTSRVTTTVAMTAEERRRHSDDRHRRRSPTPRQCGEDDEDFTLFKAFTRDLSMCAWPKGFKP